MARGRLILGWILIIFGILANAFPHVWWLVDMTQTLDTISHSAFELSMLVVIIFGIVLVLTGGKK